MHSAIFMLIGLFLIGSISISQCYPGGIERSISKRSSELNTKKRITRINSNQLSAANSQVVPIVYYGGPVVKNPVAYVIWYGNWAGNTGVALLEYFLKNIGSTSWWGITRAYNNTAPITFGKSTYDSYSQGSNLSNNAIFSIVQKAINSKSLPNNKQGIYFVLTSSDVHEEIFCTEACGWHTYDPSTGLLYAFVGNPQTQCPKGCSVQSASPNNNLGADAMANVIAHEASEAVTDPDLNAWYDSNGEEDGDKCAWTFGTIYQLPNNAYYNIQVGTKKYLIQQDWRLSSQNCSMS